MCFDVVALHTVYAGDMRHFNFRAPSNCQALLMPRGWIYMHLLLSRGIPCMAGSIGGMIAQGCLPGVAPVPRYTRLHRIL
jgi:hypothetical protein